MIYYTLLPQERIKVLKRDYRIRILITLLIFVASAIIVGIIALFPAYIISFTQEKDLVNKIENIQKDQKASGIDTVISELSSSGVLVKGLKRDLPKISFISNVEKILALRTKGITLTVFDVASSSQELAISEIMLQGQAVTRDALLNFKKNIEKEESFQKVELPISDLAKSKNIPFTMRFIIQN